MYCNADIYISPLSPGYSLILMQEIDNGGNGILNPNVCTGSHVPLPAWRTVETSVLHFSAILLICKHSRNVHGIPCAGPLWSCNSCAGSLETTLYSPAKHGRALCGIESWFREGRLFVCRLIMSLISFFNFN